MMQQPGCHFDPMLLQPIELPIVPIPVTRARTICRQSFPENRIPKRSYSKPGDQVYIARTARLVSGLDHLVTPDVADAHDTAFHAPP
jgi:hypothetical protein